MKLPFEIYNLTTADENDKAWRLQRTANEK